MRSAAIKQQIFRLILVALAFSLASCGSARDRTLEETFEQFYTVQPTANVTIKNGDGSVRIYGSNANEMRVQAIKRAYTLQRLKQIAVNVSVQPSSVSIETNFPKKQTWGLFDRSGTVDYTIVVPQTANISRVELANGEILVDAMHGPTVKASLGSGQMFAHNCFSNVEFTTDHGNVTLAYEWWDPGKFSIRANIGNGNAWAFLPGDAAFHLFAKTSHGKIANDFAERAEPAEETTTVNTSVHGGGETEIQIHAKEGNIKIVKANP